MSTLLAFGPLVVALLACLTVVLAPSVPAIERPLTRAALAWFGPSVRTNGPRATSRRTRLRAVHVGATYRTYAARTMLYAGVFAVAGSVVGVYVVAGVLAVLAVPEATVAELLPSRLLFLAGAFGGLGLSAWKLFGVVLGGSALVGFGAGFATYSLRWSLPSLAADTRKRQIDESLSRNVAFMYALSRSGMSFTEIMRILARNRSVYGEAAEEVAIAVKQMEYTGLDLIAALGQVARQTPSETFEEFAENLVNVLRSGNSLSSFLYTQYERHHEEAEAKQEQFLELLATLAEGYVSLLVVGPLLLIAILVVIGLMGFGNTVPVLQLLAYVVIPLGTVGFVVYLDSMTETLRVDSVERADADPDRAVGTADAVRSDGGTVSRTPNVERFRAYQRFRGMRRRFADPVRTVTNRPTALLVVTVPVALASVLVRVATVPAGTPVDAALVDDFVVQAALFVLGTFAVVQEYHHRRLEALEAAVPDLLERLANVNEAGMTVVESFRRVADTDLGALNEEMDRTWADVRLGADVETALRRLEARMRTPMVTRVVTLVANAMHSSGDLGRVLRIAADDAQATRRLKRSRRQEMLTYLVVIYVSFGVFLVIVVALTAILVPSLPTAETLPANVDLTGSPLGGTFLAGSNAGTYVRLLFHTALVQAVASGFVAGQMGEENVKNGAKHAAIMLAIAYAMFVLL